MLTQTRHALPLRQVLTDQPVGVLVAATLPRVVRPREDVMRRHCEGKGPDDYIFINPKTGKPYTDSKKAFKKACELAGIKGLRWNDLRHTFGTRLGIAGANAFEIKELMGHTDIRTSLRYVHPVTERKRTAVESVVRTWREGQEEVCHKSATEEERPAVRLAVSA